MLETNNNDSDIENENWTLNTPQNLENLLQQYIQREISGFQRMSALQIIVDLKEFMS